MELHIHQHLSPRDREDNARIIARLTTVIQGVAALATAVNARFDALENFMADSIAALRQEAADLKVLADRTVAQLTDLRTSVVTQTQTIAGLRDQLASVQSTDGALLEVLGGLDQVKDELTTALGPTTPAPAPASPATPTADAPAAGEVVDTGPGA